jgi:exosortase
MKMPAVWGLAFAGALSLSLGWRPLFATFTLAWRDDQYTHILLILPIAAALIWADWRALNLRPELELRWGAILLALAALAAGFVRWRSDAWSPDVKLSLAMSALVVWWIGAFVLFFGPRISRSFLFPLVFLIGLVPAPLFLVDEVVSFLQHGSAWTARLLFEAARVPVIQDGVLLIIPGLTIEVAKECSSIRSSSMLLLTTIVLAQLLLRSPWRKAFAVAVSVPLSIAKNGLRIFTIAMLGTRVDAGFLTGRLHHQGGIIFFLIALLMVCLLLWILRRGEARSLFVTPGA